MNNAIFDYEDFSSQNIAIWLAYNKNILSIISDPNQKYTLEDRINARLLKTQIQKEISKWENEKQQNTKPSIYSSLIYNAIKKVIGSNFLTIPEKKDLICQRLNSVLQLSSFAIQSLTSGNLGDIERSLKLLESTEEYYDNELTQFAYDHHVKDRCPDFETLIQDASVSIVSLKNYFTNKLLINASQSSPVLGREKYAKTLSDYTDSSLTPEELASMAVKEIDLVKSLMVETAKEYLTGQYPKGAFPKSNEDLIKLALDDMEKDAPVSSEDYLNFWQELSDKAVDFIAKNKIATLPKNESLRIMTAPESAGPAARIGWVSSAPPFAANPMTTLYFPSIPDTLPSKEQEEFWASFNKPFNRMIVIHELFPGHYMQFKISRETPHPIRLIFPYGVYAEGWATFCEKVVLDAGWEKENKLTLLAHLRKRLENANRAYTSVQSHCNSWSKEKVINFSIETSLLAPQFAKSLWGRLMNSPMQMTSYFLGGNQFRELLINEQNRLGAKFQLKEFMDTIMKAGPIPIDEFNNIFIQSSKPKE